MKTNRLQVFFHDQPVGTLAMTVNHKVAFEYSDEWLERGFPISPFSLPLKKQVFIPKKNYFQGLFGVFADSLPDAWGKLLLHRLLRKNEIDEGQINMLDRLAIVGEMGMGALTYRPVIEVPGDVKATDLDYLEQECKKILQTEYTPELDGLFRLGGTSGGARPKILTEIDGEHWMIKFPSRGDDDHIGRMEYAYSRCAKACGILMCETKLFASRQCDGYFGTKRFDRESGKRKHVLTAAALLELDYEQPSLDYHTLMKLTKILTGDHVEDLKQMFYLMCFNVFAHNRDDHAKNFSYIYQEKDDIWHLAPAYDLTYSNTYYGEHTTSVDGNGLNPGIKELVAVGTQAGLGKKWCEQKAYDISDTVGQMLAEFL
ncbi:MAG: type II toxin-antitoxin system HipA family toxin [Lachnospiraceae bacterium]|nr:type II toxin-antitoxin system HipA family toxin [Lachnospiraceae bacterium]MDY3818592.1 type II toxin-antitoxin system HipA family toxin [Lachnospiraceae bacterium]